MPRDIAFREISLPGAPLLGDRLVSPRSFNLLLKGGVRGVREAGDNTVIDRNRLLTAAKLSEQNPLVGERSGHLFPQR
jgi:hypothetical protein